MTWWAASCISCCRCDRSTNSADTFFRPQPPVAPPAPPPSMAIWRCHPCRRNRRPARPRHQRSRRSRPQPPAAPAPPAPPALGGSAVRSVRRAGSERHDRQQPLHHGDLTTVNGPTARRRERQPMFQVPVTVCVDRSSLPSSIPQTFHRRTIPLTTWAWNLFVLQSSFPTSSETNSTTMSGDRPAQRAILDLQELAVCRLFEQ